MRSIFPVSQFDLMFFYPYEFFYRKLKGMLNNNSKIIIVGAGPTGLTLAHYLSTLTNAQITVIEREATIGGIHRVRRIAPDNVFTEHGPRIYTSAYLNFRRLLQDDLKLDFFQLFTPYNNSITQIGGVSLGHLSTREIMLLAAQYFWMLISSAYSKRTTVLAFAQQNNFSPQAIDYLDRICRLSDGAGANRYTLFELLQTPNQHAFYSIYQPAYPNDHVLFPTWQRYLENNGVKFLLNTEVIRLVPNIEGNKITSVALTNNTKLAADLVLLAIPPTHVSELVNRSALSNFSIFSKNKPQYPSIPNRSRSLDYQTELDHKISESETPVPNNSNVETIQEWNEWVTESQYLMYFPITYHYYDDIRSHPKLSQSPEEIDKILKGWGFSETDWGVVWIILSDYWKVVLSDFGKDSQPYFHGRFRTLDRTTGPYLTVITVAVTRPYTPSKVTGKTADESSPEEILTETFRQLQQGLNLGLPKPDLQLISPGIQRTRPGQITYNPDHPNANYYTLDQSFMLTPAGYRPAESSEFDNLFSVGTHNGYSPYYFTTLESAMANALKMVHKLVPLSQHQYPILGPINLSSVIYLIVLLVIGFFLFK